MIKSIVEFLNGNLAAIAGAVILFIALINGRRAEKQMNEAYDMPQDGDTDRLLRQTRLLECRVWSMGWWIVFAVGAMLFFIALSLNNH